MEDFNPARPRYTLPLAGKSYELVGTMALVEAVEYALKRGIVKVVVDVTDNMPARELAQLLSAVLTACEHPMTSAEAASILWDKIGMSGDENITLRLHLYSFLSICLAPPDQREAKAKRAGELMQKLPPAASPGPSTSDSASAP